MKRISTVLALIAIASPAFGQYTARLPTTTTPDGNRTVQSIPVVNPDGTPIAAGGGGTPTGAAGSPNSNVVSVQGVSGGTPAPVIGPLTDSQLRAAAVPVTGAFYQATQPVSQQDATGSGSLALTTANAVYAIPMSAGRNALGLTISGLSGSGATITVERSNNGGTTWTNANTTESSATGSLSATITADGQARVGVAGATNIRLRVSTAGSGTATIAYNATTASGPVFLTGYLPSYSAPDGRIIGGVDSRFINGTAISTGSGTTDAGTQRVSLATDGIPQVQGNVANGATDTGNPVKIGARVSDNPPTLTANTRSDAFIGTDGTLRVSIRAPTYNLIQNLPAGQISYPTNSTGTAGYITMNGLYVYNGSDMSVVRGNNQGMNVNAIGGAAIATGQVSVGTSPTLIVAARPGRQEVTVTPTASTVFYVGATGVTTTTGLYVPAGQSVTIKTGAAVYGVVASGTLLVSEIELY